MELSRRKISPKELRALGWERVRPSNAPYLFGRDFIHKDGWKITHCGHPTALWPYILQDPSGKMLLTGVAFGNPPHYGTAWPTVASAVDYVRSLRKIEA